MKRREFLWAASAAAVTTTAAPCLPAVARADDETSPTPAPPKAEEVKLANGARLVVLTEPGSSLVVLEALFRIGRAEERGASGLNALIARAWLPGGAVTRSEALLRADAARTGSIGTRSGDDWVELWGLSASDENSVKNSAQNLFQNLLAQAEFPPTVVERARAEQLREIALRRDNLTADTLDQLRARAWGSSPYGNPLFGTETTLATVRPGDALRHFQKWFRPDRAVFVAAGGITVEAATRIVEQSLRAGGWSEALSPRTIAVPGAAVTIPFSLRDRSTGRRAPATVFAIAFLAPGTSGEGSAGDWAALQVLDTLVCGGKANRLFPLRETGTLGYDVRSNLQPGRQQSLWSAYVVGNSDINAVRDNLTGSLAALASGTKPVTAEELTRAKALLRTNHLRERQRLKERAFGAGWAEIMGLGAAFDTDFAARVEAVTIAAVQKMAERVFGTRPAVVYSLPPKAPEPPPANLRAE